MSQEQIAKVLAEHYEYNWEPDAESWECQCGHLLGEDVFRRDADPNHRAHQAAVLVPLFTEAQAEALREAAVMLETDASESSYREEAAVTQAQLDAATFIRSRATHIEGRALVARIHERKGQG